MINDVEVVSHIKVEESGVFVGLSTLEDYVLLGFWFVIRDFLVTVWVWC